MSYPTIEIACEKAIAADADELIVVPVFLFSAINIKHEIPKILDSLTKKYPEITIKMTKTFGFDPEIIALAKEKNTTNEHQFHEFRSGPARWTW